MPPLKVRFRAGSRRLQAAGCAAATAPSRSGPLWPADAGAATLRRRAARSRLPSSVLGSAPGASAVAGLARFAQRRGDGGGVCVRACVRVLGGGGGGGGHGGPEPPRAIRPAGGRLQITRFADRDLARWRRYQWARPVDWHTHGWFRAARAGGCSAVSSAGQRRTPRLGGLHPARSWRGGTKMHSSSHDVHR